jgi:hypothetical protein
MDMYPSNNNNNLAFQQLSLSTWTCIPHQTKLITTLILVRNLLPSLNQQVDAKNHIRRPNGLDSAML